MRAQNTVIAFISSINKRTARSGFSPLRSLDLAISTTMATWTPRITSPGELVAAALADYKKWRANFGASLGSGSGSVPPSAEPLSATVPKPATFVLLTLAAARICRHRHRNPTRLKTRSCVRHAINPLFLNRSSADMLSS